MHLSALYLYPVKSLRGLSVREARCDALGLVNDRRFLIIEESGKAVTQRGDPSLARLGVALGDDNLVLSRSGAPDLLVPLRPQPGALLRPTEVWRAAGMLAEDCGAQASAWLAAFLGRPVHLVRIGEAFRRPIPVRKMPLATAHRALFPGEAGPWHDTQGTDIPTDHTVSFADAYPFLLLGEASLEELNKRLLAQGLPSAGHERFRANLLLAGAAPHEEDTLSRFRLGEVVFQAGGGCSRCIMITNDPATGERSAEPLRTLAGYRRDPAKTSDVLFGQNLVHETKSGVLRVGDILQRL